MSEQTARNILSALDGEPIRQNVMAPLDDRLQRFIGELRGHAGSGDPKAIDRISTQFVVDLFDEIEKAIRNERDKVGPNAAVFWGWVKDAIGQIKRRSVDL